MANGNETNFQVLNDAFAAMFNTVPDYIWYIVVILLFTYILIYSFLQVRQVRVLQGKIQTSADSALRFFSYIYFIVQILIFVVTLLLL
jgi:uncharacterized MnhB-related membrane protein